MSNQKHTIQVYGIKNCQTVKKALAWLQAQHLKFTFHDYKKEGVPEARLLEWMHILGWENLINKKGTTWRKLNPDTQNSVVDAYSALRLMGEYSSVIKRPILEFDEHKKPLIGFDEHAYAQSLLAE